MSIDAVIAALPFSPIPEGESYCEVTPLAQIITPSSSATALYRAPTFSFYVKHEPSGKTLFFDLGIRYDWETGFAEDLRNFIKPAPPVMVGDVGALLKEGGANPEDVSGVIISHRHWDHTGNIAPFPKAEVVGGIDTFNADLGRQTAGRQTLVLDWSRVKSSKIGSFDHAYDYFGDGSIWLCDSAGHTAGHLSALVRTTPSPNATYVLLSGDTCHHPFLISPTTHNFRLATYPARGGSDNPRKHPGLPPPCCMHSDMERAWDTVCRTRRMEAEDNVMVVLGHDYVYWREWRDNLNRLWPNKAGIHGWKKDGLKMERKYEPEKYDIQ
ncbi:Metallo-hydrolase/oxidoreductase [Dacryopinax primogenitus]|uniref:Metallo-hydrolase/oxidoreductase n=1 Tax=Dacryopinax primogenitus (strain DJM 731) TaxID=1858805 RepID=M5FWM5_DACPD|nr:Metallo-hydrolase/oxidoreductase [Dacryopinax primogenitus]EJU00789.1 Metallo-hydrolase/oxidoreductase [Dacryopinax primogenitus]